MTFLLMQRLAIIAFSILLIACIPMVLAAENSLGKAKNQMAHGDYKDARKHFEQVLSGQPDNPEALVGLADALLGMGHADQAYAKAKQASLRHPNYGPAYLVLARVHEGRGETEQAKHFYSQYVKHSKGEVSPGLLLKLRKMGVY
jgi:Tfp pilus assembly protein PilF